LGQGKKKKLWEGVGREPRRINIQPKQELSSGNIKPNKNKKNTTKHFKQTKHFLGHSETLTAKRGEKKKKKPDGP